MRDNSQSKTRNLFGITGSNRDATSCVCFEHPSCDLPTTAETAWECHPCLYPHLLQSRSDVRRVSDHLVTAGLRRQRCRPDAITCPGWVACRSYVHPLLRKIALPIGALPAGEVTTQPLSVMYYFAVSKLALTFRRATAVLDRVEIHADRQ